MSAFPSFWPTAAALHAARFEVDYLRMQDAFALVGKPPPSREVVLDEARRDPRRDVFEILAMHRRALR